MARDLILGRTSRDWSCGSLTARQQAAEDVIAQLEVEPLAETVDREVQQSFRRVAALHSRGLMPTNRRKAFGSLMRRWLSFKESRGGKYLGSDYVEVANFRDEVRRYSYEIGPLERAAATRTPEQNSPCRDCSPGPPTIKKILGLGGLLGAGYLLTKKLLTPGRYTP